MNFGCDVKSHEQEQRDVSAERIQRWFVRLKNWKKVAAKLTSPAILSSLALAVAAMNSVSSLGFEEASDTMSRDSVLKAIQLILSALPHDATVDSLPRDSRSPRAFLSTALIVHHPRRVLFDGSEEEEAAAGSTTVMLPSLEMQILRTSSSFVVAALNVLHNTVKSSSSSSSPPPPSRSLSFIRRDVKFFLFSRRFFASAMTSWRDIDSERLAASIISPYSQTFSMLLAAERIGDEPMISAATQQLAKMRQVLQGLIGEKRTKDTVEEVETSVRVTMVAHFQSEDDALREEREKKLRADEEREALKKVQAEGEQKQREFVTKFMANMSVTNERLVHEIILNSNYRIPGSSAADVEEEEEEEEGDAAGKPTGSDEPDASDNSPAAQARRLQNSMRRVFWDRLVVSLTKPTQSGPKDFVVGAQIQCRYGTSTGAFYTATIVGRNDSGGNDDDDDDDDDEPPTFDVRWSEDNIVEKGVSVERFRTTKDPIDYGPLLGLLDEVKSKLLSVAPKRAFYVDQINANIDLGLITQMLSNTALDSNSMLGFVAFVCEKILEFQAPARSRKTKAWIDKYMAELESVAVANMSVVPMLPKLLEWVFGAIDEITKDIANSHVDMLRPYLAQHGREYERQSFANRLSGGALSLVNTRRLIAETVEVVGKSGIEVDGFGPALLARIVEKRESSGFLALLAASFVTLLRRNVRLDARGYESVEGGLPETLLWDAKVLATTRDKLDAMCLVSTVIILLRQVLARIRVVPNAEVFLKVQSDLDVLLNSQGVSMPDIEQYAVSKARELCKSVGGGTLPEAEEKSFRSLITNAAHPDNAVFKLYVKRAEKLVIDALRLGKPVLGMEGVELAEKIRGGGFASFIKSLTPVLNDLVAVFAHTVAVHNEWHTTIAIEEIVKARE